MKQYNIRGILACIACGRCCCQYRTASLRQTKCGGFQIIDSHSLSVRPEPRHATDNARENESACQRVIIMSIYLPRSDSEQPLDARLGAPSLSISFSKVVKVVNKVRRSAGENWLVLIGSAQLGRVIRIGLVGLVRLDWFDHFHFDHPPKTLLSNRLYLQCDLLDVYGKPRAVHALSHRL